MKNVNYDVIIIGLGAIGSSALYYLSKSDLKLAGFDTFVPPHHYGSSHGESRIIRQAIGEDFRYSTFSMQSYELWKEIERLTGRKLIFCHGGLIIAPNDGQNAFFQNTIQAAEKFNIPHEILSEQEITRRFPEFSNISNMIGYYEYNAGFAIPELIVSTQIELAKNNGAEPCCGEKIINLEVGMKGIVCLTTDQGRKVTASKVIVTAGPWINQFLPLSFKNLVKVFRQVLYWFEILDNAYFDPTKFPVFIMNFSNNNGIYGFPGIPKSKNGFKVATHNTSIPIDQNIINRSVEELEIQAFYQDYIEPYFSPNIVSSNCMKTAVCSYTMTPDEGFIVDFDPNSKNILFVSACSGHGFKHSASIGQIVAELTLEKDLNQDIKLFSWDRFKNNT